MNLLQYLEMGFRRNIHVDDVVQANINSASSYGVSEAFNIASGTRITINDLVKLSKIIKKI